MCQSSELKTWEPVLIVSLPSSLEGRKEEGSEKGEGEEEKRMKEKTKETKKSESE